MIEINKLREKSGLTWRLTATIIPKGYGATIQLRGEILGDPKNLLSLIATDLAHIASEIEKEDTE
jgi:hypothetical protein